MTIHSNIPLHLRRSVSIRPISARSWLAMEGDRRFTHASAFANYLYIVRGKGTDARGTVDYRHRGDLVAHGLELPSDHPHWAREEGRVWQELDAAAATLPADAVKAWHVVVTLPAEAAPDEWIAMVRRYARDSIAAHGPAVAWAIHADGSSEQGAPPHAHLLMTTRVWRHGARHGQTVPNWCGPAMRQRLHTDWLSALPDEMRRAATSAYRCGSFAPALPDCSALERLISASPTEVGAENPATNSAPG